ncbi:MAG: hypothetical protein ABIR49_07120 [Nitrosospira sp.]
MTQLIMGYRASHPYRLEPSNVVAFVAVSGTTTIMVIMMSMPAKPLVCLIVWQLWNFKAWFYVAVKSGSHSPLQQFIAS